MTLEERLSIIEDNVTKRRKEQSARGTEYHVQVVSMLLKIEEIKSRIQDILILANKCVEYRIGIPSKMYAKYSESRAIGLIGEKGKEIHYIGFYQNGNPCFYTNGTEATSSGGNTLYIEQLKEPGRAIDLEKAENFLNKFEKFEKMFYKWTDALETKTGMESPLWCENLTLSEWVVKHEHDQHIMELYRDKSEEWVRANFRTDDLAIVWLDYIKTENEPRIVHCYLKRDDYFLDMRGETDNEEEMKEGFECVGESARYLCHDIEDFKSIIRRLKGYTDLMWQKGKQKSGFVFSSPELEEQINNEIEEPDL